MSDLREMLLKDCKCGAYMVHACTCNNPRILTNREYNELIERIETLEKKLNEKTTPLDKFKDFMSIHTKLSAEEINILSKRKLTPEELEALVKKYNI